MPKYKPQLLSFDQERYDNDIKKKKKGEQIFKEAIQWVKNHIDIPPKDIKRFSWSFTEYFEENYYEKNKDKIKLRITPEKLLNLSGIDLIPLRHLEEQFNTYQVELHWEVSDNGHWSFDINENDYKTFTKSSEENKKLRDANLFIEAIEKIQHHTTVYPYQIHNATNGFISYDMRSNKYKVSI